MDRPNTVSSIRQEQSRLLRSVGELRARCTARSLAKLAAQLDAFERLLREHVGLVDAVLDAMTEDDVAPES